MDSSLKKLFDNQGLATFVCYTCLDSNLFFSKNLEDFKKNVAVFINEEHQCKKCLQKQYVFRDSLYNLLEIEYL